MGFIGDKRRDKREHAEERQINEKEKQRECTVVIGLYIFKLPDSFCSALT